jgi:ribosomal protein L11 methyltransferase
MNYLAYHFKVTPPEPGTDILIALTADKGFESFDISKEGFTAYIKEADSADIDLNELQFDDFTFSYTVEKLAPENWNETWERNFEPVVVDDLLCIRASFHEKNTQVQHEIVITPKMSFGTGHHQTTRLMCREMFTLDLKEKRVLDMGCGTGILAILAKKLGAGEVTGIDIDEWSVENAMENCEVNGHPDIVIKKGDVDLLKDEAAFDIILANINKNILKKQIPGYSLKMKPGGWLLLSGFFTTDVNELAVVCRDNHFELRHSVNEEEWAMMVLNKGQ